MVFQVSPAKTKIEYHYNRLNFLELLFGIGTILYTLRSISSGLVLRFQDFSIDHSMLRKLYSKEMSNQNEEFASKVSGYSYQTPNS